jgi:hypothetical protein
LCAGTRWARWQEPSSIFRAAGALPVARVVDERDRGQDYDQWASDIEMPPRVRETMFAADRQSSGVICWGHEGETHGTIVDS